jgi:hypothetical protein
MKCNAWISGGGFQKLEVVHRFNTVEASKKKKEKRKRGINEIFLDDTGVFRRGQKART